MLVGQVSKPLFFSSSVNTGDNKSQNFLLLGLPLPLSEHIYIWSI